MPNIADTKRTTIAPNGSQGGRGVWPLSEALATSIYDAANIGLIVALVGSVIATVLIVWMGNIKEEYLRREVSSAQERAAEANQKAEEERLARVKIEERLANRTLTDAQVTTIADAVKQFVGQEFNVTTYWNHIEAKPIAARIYAALVFAGWIFSAPASAEFLFPGETGVLVYIHPSADEQTKVAAELLVSALIKEGIVSELRAENAVNNLKHNKIKLNVGTKP